MSSATPASRRQEMPRSRRDRAGDRTPRELLRQLDPAGVKERLEQLLEAALDNQGDDVSS